MNSFKNTLTAALTILAGIGHAATPEEEARFLAALREACLKQDKEALVALSNWDRVPPEIKRQAIEGMAHVINDPIKSIEYEALDESRVLTRTINGITYTPNLPVTKQIAIVYDLKVGSSTGTLLAGEKDGKLMIVNLAPQQ